MDSKYKIILRLLKNQNKCKYKTKYNKIIIFKIIKEKTIQCPNSIQVIEVPIKQYKMIFSYPKMIDFSLETKRLKGLNQTT